MPKRRILLWSGILFDIDAQLLMRNAGPFKMHNYEDQYTETF